MDFLSPVGWGFALLPLLQALRPSLLSNCVVAASRWGALVAVRQVAEVFQLKAMCRVDGLGLCASRLLQIPTDPHGDVRHNVIALRTITHILDVILYLTVLEYGFNRLTLWTVSLVSYRAPSLRA